jgi:hypothetical protein
MTKILVALKTQNFGERFHVKCRQNIVEDVRAVSISQMFQESKTTMVVLAAAVTNILVPCQHHVDWNPLIFPMYQHAMLN